MNRRLGSRDFGGKFRAEEDGGKVKRFDFLPKLGDREDELCAGVFGLFGELGDSVEGIDSGGDGARSDDGEERDCELDGVGSEDENDGAF